MTVVLLNRYRPDLIPLRARAALVGTVLVTEDVPASTLWELEHVVPVGGPDDPALPLLSTDPGHPVVRSRIAAGDQVISTPVRSGEALLDAVSLMDTLRRNGPWESTQTHDSLRRYLIEEVYELLDAIDSDDAAHLREELGDLLLQVLFHSRVAADRAGDAFDIDDVARAFTSKVEGRTPGVLSGAHADLETQVREWEERKAAEKARGSVLDGIADSQPALALTQKVLERLSAAGYPVAGVDPQILTVSVWTGQDSVEDATRRRVLALMAQVRDIEVRAAADGVTLDAPDVWLRYLDDAGADPVPTPDTVAAAQGADVTPAEVSVDSAEDLVENTDDLAESTEDPAETTENPTEGTENPTEGTENPTEGTEDARSVTDAVTERIDISSLVDEARVVDPGEPLVDAEPLPAPDDAPAPAPTAPTS